jgi:hypothetical protein
MKNICVAIDINVVCILPQLDLLMCGVSKGKHIVYNCSLTPCFNKENTRTVWCQEIQMSLKWMVEVLLSQMVMKL